MAKRRDDISLTEVREALNARSERVKTKTINLRNFKVTGPNTFSVDGLTFTVRTTESGMDSNPIRQLCSAIGMSPGFFHKNPTMLNQHIFEERFRLLDEEEASRNLRYVQEEDGTNRMLALLPLEHQAPNYVDIIEPLFSVLPKDAAIIRLSNHEHVNDEHRLSMRISLTDYQLKVQGRNHDPENCDLGLFIDMSEDGRGGKMTLTSMLYNQWCTNGAMVSYDSNPYFTYNYRGIRAVDLSASIKSAIGRVGDDMQTIFNLVQESEEKMIMTKNGSLGFLKAVEERRDVSLGFIRKIRKEVEASNVESISRWRVINHITQHAQGLPYDRRVQHEFVAGSLLGLNLANAA